MWVPAMPQVTACRGVTVTPGSRRFMVSQKTSFWAWGSSSYKAAISMSPAAPILHSRYSVFIPVPPFG